MDDFLGSSNNSNANNKDGALDEAMINLVPVPPEPKNGGHEDISVSESTNANSKDGALDEAFINLVPTPSDDQHAKDEDTSDSSDPFGF